MAHRITVTEGVRDGILRLMSAQPCDVCSDWLDRHEWFDVQGVGTRTVKVVRCSNRPEAPRS